MKRYIKASENAVKLKVLYLPYERYGGSDTMKAATVSGVDLLDALKKMTDHMTLYLDSDQIEEDGLTADDVILSIDEANGDGCDYIVSLTNLTNGETLIEGDYDFEEEDWD